MPLALVRCYAEMLPRLAAEQVLADSQAATYPHMKQSAQREWHRSMQKAAKPPQRRRRSQPATDKDLAAVGITVERAS